MKNIIELNTDNLNICIEKLNLNDNDSVIISINNFQLLTEEELFNRMTVIKESLETLYPNNNFIFLPNDIAVTFKTANIEDIDNLINLLKNIKHKLLGIIL